MKMETLKRQILTAKGDVRAELVLKNARVITCSQTRSSRPM